MSAMSRRPRCSSSPTAGSPPEGTPTPAGPRRPSRPGGSPTRRAWRTSAGAGCTPPGSSSAALAAAAAPGLDPSALDAAADARTPSPALRAAARRLGRQLMRAARATWPSAELDALARRVPQGGAPAGRARPHRPGGRARGRTDAAYCAAYERVSGPATAAVRLLSLDPFEATGVLARLAPEMDAVADAAAEAARGVGAPGWRAARRLRAAAGDPRGGACGLARAVVRLLSFSPPPPLPSPPGAAPLDPTCAPMGCAPCA